MGSNSSGVTLPQEQVDGMADDARIADLATLWARLGVQTGTIEPGSFYAKYTGTDGTGAGRDNTLLTNAIRLVRTAYPMIPENANAALISALINASSSPGQKPTTEQIEKVLHEYNTGRAAVVASVGRKTNKRGPADQRSLYLDPSAAEPVAVSISQLPALPDAPQMPAPTQEESGNVIMSQDMFDAIMQRLATLQESVDQIQAARRDTTFEENVGVGIRSIAANTVVLRNGVQHIERMLLANFTGIYRLLVFVAGMVAYLTRLAWRRSAGSDDKVPEDQSGVAWESSSALNIAELEKRLYPHAAAARSRILREADEDEKRRAAKQADEQNRAR